MKLAIFDMDGLLLDTERLTRKKLGEIMNKHGYTLEEKFFLKLVGVNADKYKEIMLNTYGTDYPHNEISSSVRRAVTEELRSGKMPIKYGIPELLEFLKKKGISCAVASSTKTEYVKEYMRLAGLDKYFDLIVGGDSVSRSKPFPDIFLKACDELGVQPEDAVVFEDSENGIKAAVNGGIPVVCIFDIKHHDKDITDLCMFCANNALEAMEYLKK